MKQNIRKNRDLNSVNVFKEKINDLFEENRLCIDNRNKLNLMINRFLKDYPINQDSFDQFMALDFLYWSKKPNKIDLMIKSFLLQHGI